MTGEKTQLENSKEKQKLTKENILLSMLFAHAEPLPLKKLQLVLGWEKAEIQEAILQLNEKLSCWPLSVLEVAGGYMLVTKKAYTPYLKKLLKPPLQKLNPKTLETLAIIAFRQPLTKQEIEQIRGVSVDGSLETLLRCKLIKIAGRKESPGKPYLFRTTDTFLKFFGLKSLRDLPRLELDLEKLMEQKINQSHNGDQLPQVDKVQERTTTLKQQMPERT